MGGRLQLSQRLHEMFDPDVKIYFRKPNEPTMEYPCIIYELDDVNVSHADNTSYIQTNRYQVTVIDRNADTTIPGRILGLPMCEFDRKFSTQGLDHYVLTLYF